jgi:Flp pilus assembly protein TadG
LVLAALAAFVILGILGLAIDLCRLYITKNEVYNFTDSASVFAVKQLDGSLAGITDAETAAKPISQSGTNPNRWAFGTDGTFQSVNVTFATELNGTYEDGATIIGTGSAAGYRFAQVSAFVPVPIYFAAIFPSVGFSQNIGATSVAGQGLVTGQSDGIFPFSPDAHNPNDPEFGYLRGEYYTMWYDKPTGNFDGPNNPNLIQGLDGDWYIGCPGDLAVKSLGFQPGENSPSLHGYMDMKPYLPNPKSGGTALIRDVIHGVVDFDDSMDIGDPVYPEPGTKTAARVAIQDRVSDPTWGDTDYTTVKYYNTAQVPNGPFPYDSALFTPDVDTMNNVPGYRLRLRTLPTTCLRATIVESSTCPSTMIWWSWAGLRFSCRLCRASQSTGVATSLVPRAARSISAPVWAAAVAEGPAVQACSALCCSDSASEHDGS